MSSSRGGYSASGALSAVFTLSQMRRESTGSRWVRCTMRYGGQWWLVIPVFALSHKNQAVRITHQQLLPPHFHQSGRLPGAEDA